MFQCCSLKSSHPCLLPQSPKVSFAVSHISHIFSSHTLLPLEAKNPFSLSYHFSANLLLLFFSHLIMSDSFVTPWTVAPQVPLSMGFPRQEYWSGLPFPSLRELPNPGIKPASPALAGGFFTNEPPRKPSTSVLLFVKMMYKPLSLITSLGLSFYFCKPLICTHDNLFLFPLLLIWFLSA